MSGLTRDVRMETTYSKPHKQWPGFSNTAYRIEWDRARGLQLEVIWRRDEEESTRELERTTLGDLQLTLASAGELSIDEETDEIVLLDGRHLTIVEPSFAERLLEVFAKARMAGYSAATAQLFYIEEDHCLEEHMRSFSFFVVAGRDIVENHVSFVDHERSGFDPDCFVMTTANDYVWHNERRNDEAFIRWCYRKFFKETFAGQLIALRGERPVLYDDSAEMWASVFVGPIQQQLRSIYNLLRWALLALVILLIILLYRQ